MLGFQSGTRFPRCPGDWVWVVALAEQCGGQVFAVSVQLPFSRRAWPVPGHRCAGCELAGHLTLGWASPGAALGSQAAPAPPSGGSVEGVLLLKLGQHDSSCPQLRFSCN